MSSCDHFCIFVQNNDKIEKLRREIAGSLGVFIITELNPPAAMLFGGWSLACLGNSFATRHVERVLTGDLEDEKPRDESCLGRQKKALDRFAALLDRARQTALREPTAVTLATVDAEGRPSARVVLLRGHDERGFVFYSNSQSKKGLDLAANPSAALCFLSAALCFLRSSSTQCLGGKSR